MKTVEVHVRGRVQGVGFRAFVRRKAYARKISGHVENCLDGSVHALIRGDADKIAEMIDAIKRGPPGSQVVECTVSDSDAIPYADDFVIRR